MITELILRLKKDRKDYISQNISSLLQGVLMEYVDYEYGQVLHQSNLKPYNQHIIVLEEEVIWNIKTLNTEAYEQISKRLYEEERASIYLKHKNLELDIIEKKLHLYDNQKLIEDYFFGQCPRRIQLEFTSPTAFKSNGEYVFYPSIHKIFQSLIRKFDSFNEDNSLGREELLADICAAVKIIEYKVRSKRFHLEGIAVSGFVGQVTLVVQGPQQLVNVVNLLLRYGEYSGVGIKTAIGMGAIKICERTRRE